MCVEMKLKQCTVCAQKKYSAKVFALCEGEDFSYKSEQKHYIKIQF